MLLRISRSILGLACLCGAVQIAGCAGFIEEQRQIRIQNRADDIVWKEMVPPYEFQHSCQEVSEAVAQYLITQGDEIDKQSDTRVVTEKKYLNQGGRFDEPMYQQTRHFMVTLRSTGAGCRIEATGIDSYGGKLESSRAPNVELRTIEKLEPEKAQAMHAEAKRRAEAENPRAQPAAAAPKSDGKTSDTGGEKVAATPGKAGDRPQEKKAAPVAPEKAEPAAAAADKSEPVAAASEEETPASAVKKKQQPIKMDAEASPAPAALPTFEIAAAPLAGLNRSLTFVGQRTNMFNPGENNMRPYSLGYGPSATVSVVWYPLAGSGKGILADFGVEGSLEQGFFIQTSLGPDDPTLPNATFGATVHDYQSGVRYRMPIGGGNQVWFSLTAGEHAFVFTSSSDCALSTPNTCRPNLNSPDTIYRYLRPGIGLRLELPSNFALAATAGFRYTPDGGDQFGEAFPHHTVYGLDASAYLGYRVIPSVEIRLGGDVRRYGFEMNSTPEDVQAVMAGGTPIKIATGGSDRYVLGTIGVAFLGGVTK